MQLAPVDIATRETADFLAAALPARARVLEVGCGEGHVAAELQRRGFAPIAIDSDPDAVAASRQKGVDARVASWPECDVGATDAVAFTRSLHHLSSLDAALAAACARLRPNGSILVEDFAPEDVDEATVGWFVSRLRSPQARALLAPPAGSLAALLLQAENPFTAWTQDRSRHEVHPFTAMRAAMATHSYDSKAAQAPYFYRYLIPALPVTAGAAAFVAEVFEEERRLTETGRIVALGRRLVGAVR